MICARAAVGRGGVSAASGQRLFDRRGQGRDVAWRYELSELSVLKQIAVAADPGCHHRPARGEGLDEGDRSALVPRAVHDHVEICVELRQVMAPAKEGNRLRDTETKRFGLERCTLRAVAGNDEVQVGAPRAQQPRHLQERSDVLDRREPADDADEQLRRLAELRAQRTARQDAAEGREVEAEGNRVNFRRD